MELVPSTYYCRYEGNIKARCKMVPSTKVALATVIIVNLPSKVPGIMDLIPYPYVNVVLALPYLGT